ncbi:MAG: HAD family phosphatase [Planctomycetota bacterium]|nr:HAD family phosphatase [Planctomycetota bacterium]
MSPRCDAFFLRRGFERCPGVIVPDNPPKIGVIFDVDGVLVDSYAAHFESWRALAVELGAQLSEEQFAGTFGRTSRDIISQLFGARDAVEVRRLDDRKESLYRQSIRGRVPAMPGALECVRACHLAGFVVAVGSSGPPENVQLVCDEIGLTSLLAAMVTGRDVVRGKPDPQVFQLAAERMQLAASDCIVIEDAPAGIEAAVRAGMRSIGFAGSHPSDSLRKSDRVISRLTDLTPDLIRMVFARR